MLNCRGTVLAADVRTRDETDAIVGARGAMSSRIIGGVIPDSPLSKYAHVVAIFVQSGMSEYFRCGGTLISNVHIPDSRKWMFDRKVGVRVRARVRARAG